MEQSLPKKTPDISDLCRLSCPMESSKNICDRNIPPRPSCAIQDTPKDFICDPSILKRWSDSYLDEGIKTLLRESLVRRIVKGYPFENIQHHRTRLIGELNDWIGVEHNNCSSVQEPLVNLLVTASKQNVKQMPLDYADWLKLLNQWIKANNTCGVISSRRVYRILAVDGFRGFQPKHLKMYLKGVLFPMRMQYEAHHRGVRHMYDFFDKNVSLSSITGTDSACIVFLALLRWYSDKKNLMSDDQIAFKVKEAESWAEGYLQQHAEYYQDIRNVDERVYKDLGEIYAGSIGDCAVGIELLQSLNESI